MEGATNNFGCPFGGKSSRPYERKLQEELVLSGSAGDGGIPEGGFKAVMDDIKALLTDSQDFWPGDFDGTPHGPHYGGLFIRLAWHCSGSYRDSDGRGGCDGGRIRFDPELNWMDNGNLDKGLLLLDPIKKKYGSKLSWGDLIVLSGTAAIEGMGGTIAGFCGGRIDDANGDNSLKLGPSREQEEIGPCQNLQPSKQGQCLAVEGTALGPTTVGLIYVNPAGPVTATGDPVASGEDVRTAFARMGFNDTETVALVGGGHAFGKGHGACLKAPCGEGELQGKGPNTYTAGFEGPWTTTPTTWSNQYFNNLFDFEWQNWTGPGGNLQWKPIKRTDDAEGDLPEIMMLTADVALAADEKYKVISEMYAKDLGLLTTDFAAAWYRLTSQDMGPSSRCIGDSIPPPALFQNDLPKGQDMSALPDFVPVRAEIQKLIDSDDSKKAAFIDLAFNCASTYRATDYRGGCNGARIRFPPESDWKINAGAAATLETLKAVKTDGISFADLIVLAGQAALEASNADLTLKFCGGRVDADAGAFQGENLAPRKYADAAVSVMDDFLVKGLTQMQGVALMARGNLSSQYFKDLMGQSADSDSLTFEEKGLLASTDLNEIVKKFAEDEASLLENFASGWTYLMTADRFKGNSENMCTGVDTPTKSGGEKPADMPSAEGGNKPTAPEEKPTNGDNKPTAAKPTAGVEDKPTSFGSIQNCIVGVGIAAVAAMLSM